MGEILSSLPPEIQVHIKQITKGSGMSEADESFESMAQAWLDKKVIFEERTTEKNMAEVDEVLVDDNKGCVALTYSGSLILVGPLKDGVRKAAYNSIGIRTNVPESAVQEESILGAPIAVNKPIVFEKGPVQSTSSIFKIAQVQEDLPAVVEEEQISEVTVIMTSEFVDVNKALVPSD